VLLGRRLQSRDRVGADGGRMAQLAKSVGDILRVHLVVLDDQAAPHCTNDSPRSASLPTGKYRQGTRERLSCPCPAPAASGRKPASPASPPARRSPTTCTCPCSRAVDPAATAAACRPGDVAPPRGRRPSG